MVLLIAYMCPYSPEIIFSSFFFCPSGKETVENLKISRGQIAPCQESRIKRQQTVSSAGCKVLAPNAGCLLASMPSYCRFRPIECCYSQSVSVSVPQDQIRGSAIGSRAAFATALACAILVGKGVESLPLWPCFERIHTGRRWCATSMGASISKHNDTLLIWLLVCLLFVIFGVQFKPFGEKLEIHSLCFYICDCVSRKNVSASTLLVATSHVPRPPSPPNVVRVPDQPLFLCLSYCSSTALASPFDGTF